MSDPAALPRVAVPGYPPGYAPPPARDSALIPRGDYCYRLLAPGEPVPPGADAGTFGADRRVDDDGARLLCPFWYRTPDGAGCAFLGVEAIDPTDADAPLVADTRFGDRAARERRSVVAWDLPDEIRICDVNVPERILWQTGAGLRADEVVGPVPLPAYLAAASPPPPAPPLPPPASAPQLSRPSSEVPRADLHAPPHGPRRPR